MTPSAPARPPTSRPARLPRCPREFTHPHPHSHPHPHPHHHPSYPITPIPSSRQNLPPTNPNSTHRHVILKLLAFTLAMIVMPIGSYYATVNTLFKGKKKDTSMNLPV